MYVYTYLAHIDYNYNFKLCKQLIPGDFIFFIVQKRKQGLEVVSVLPEAIPLTGTRVGIHTLSNCLRA